ncbi:MAG TPA: oligosaccharide flippase family protein [Thermomicrobiales bacterium]|nr:oligosaccharide flippase family protein [Thermomicrobiales bacterium]
MAIETARISVAGRITGIGIRGLLGKNLWVFADQALISAANFFFMVLLARQLGAADFGQFVLTYTVLMFTNSLQGALFTQPHNVLGATRHEERYRDYTTATTLTQTGFAIIMGLLISTVAIGALALGHDVGWSLLALAPTSITWQLHEFVRRILFTQSAATTVFALDVIAYGGQIGLLVVLWQTGWLSVTSALVAIGVASGCGLVVGLWRVRDHLGSVPTAQSVRATFHENWIFGRWLLGSAIAYWLSTQLYPILIAGFVGVAATGGLRAAQTLLGPTHILLKGLESIAPSDGARAYERDGATGLRRSLKRLVVPGGIAMAAYCGTVAFLAGPLVQALLGDGYESFSWLVRVYALFYAFSFLNAVASIALRSMGLSAPMFFAQGTSAVVVLTLGVAAVALFGLVGAAIGVVVNGAMIATVLWYRVHREMARPPAQSTEYRSTIGVVSIGFDSGNDQG